VYAVVENGGKNYKVSPGDILYMDSIPEAKDGKVRFDKVLLFSDGSEVKVGEPYVEGVEVDAVVEDVVKDKKVIVFKYKPKTKYRRKKGHRQIYYKVRVEGINVGGSIS